MLAGKKSADAAFNTTATAITRAIKKFLITWNMAIVMVQHKKRSRSGNMIKDWLKVRAKKLPGW